MGSGGDALSENECLGKFRLYPVITAIRDGRAGINCCFQQKIAGLYIAILAKTNLKCLLH